METGYRFEHVELSTIDTSLLLAGVLFCQSYFDRRRCRPRPRSARYADSLYRRVDWTWVAERPPLVSMGWTPEKGVQQLSTGAGYDEAMILYILALGSPTHPIDAGRVGRVDEHVPVGHVLRPAARRASRRCSGTSTRTSGSTSAASRTRTCAARGSTTSRTRAARRSRSAPTRSTIPTSGRATARTCGDSPRATARSTRRHDRRQVAHVLQLRRARRRLRPRSATTARSRRPPPAGRSPFAPEIAIPALVAMREKYGDHLFTKYGFLDAFNPTFPTPSAHAAGRARRPGRRLVRHRLPRHRPGPDHRDDRELSQRAGLEDDAQESVHRRAA